MKKTVYKKLVAVMLAITFAAATFGLKGNIKEVNAEENDAEPYYLIGLCGNYDDEYAFNSCGLFASDFDSKGNYEFYVTRKVCPDYESPDFSDKYDPHAIYLYYDGLPDESKDIIDNHMIGIGENHIDKKWDVEEKITVNKSQFKYDPDCKEYRVYFYLVCDYKNQWVDGQWFDGSGSKSYTAKGSWNGSGTSFWFQDSSGWYPKDSWLQIDFSWFYFKSDGYCACNEWLQIDGSWYYFNKDGYYCSDCWIDGYYLNKDGTQTYGPTGKWNSDDKGWWFSDSSGWYPCDEEVGIDGEYYFFKADGYMACNEWVQTKIDKEGDGKSWSYYDSNGLYDWYKSGYYDEKNEWHYYGSQN